MGRKIKTGWSSQPFIRDQGNSPDSMYSGLSAKVVTSAFFEPSPIPKHAQSQTWKSKESKQREEFERTRNLLQHFAPEQFKPCAKPTNGPANIVPQTLLQYQIYGKETEAEELLKKIAILESKKLRKKLEPIRQVFDGKEFKSSRSSVLSHPTIWSPNFAPTLDHPKVPWPDRDQLHEDGERRENKYAPTRCGRFLPALRYPDTGLFMPQYPLDQVGPLRSQGPTPAECQEANGAMDFDQGFEEEGVKLLGGELMHEIGAYQSPFVPDWLAQYRRAKEMASGHYYQY